MNWGEAIEAMKAGKHVRRRADAVTHTAWVGDMPIKVSGEEAMCLRAAWTVDNQPVMVFCGSESRCLLVPEARHVEATDWEIAEE